MSKLSIIIRHEYLTEVKGKSFWLGTVLTPIILLVFGAVIGVLAADSESMQTMMDFGSGISKEDADEMDGPHVLAMMVGMLLTFFVMGYGGSIFNKVKIEKVNRIMEVLATCVPGRTLMMAKIISTGLIGLTQLLIWGILIGIGLIGMVIVLNIPIPFQKLLDVVFLKALFWGSLFFIGGYIFFGSLFACVGAMTDRDNDNQQYVTLLTFTLLGSFYLGMYVVDHGTGAIATIFGFVPFTATTIASVGAISGDTPIWLSLLELAVLYGFAYASVAVAGKIYTSTMMLKGKKFTPRDIITFLKAK